ncbi:MAG: ribonuclease HI family protein [Terracidiphilus sp.]|nr:ribonuclease HI family protein [Terracidiphilus sp.]
MTGNLFSASDPSGQQGWFTAHCDGGSRGNPGPSGYGAVVEDPQGRVVARLSHFLGVQTNNYAEYSGLLAVLKWANENGTKRLRVVSDSELMVKQMKGQYKVASPVLRPLYEEARRLSARLDKFEMRHTLRGGNKEADQLANEAMDKGMGKNREQGSATPVSTVRSQGAPAGNREQGQAPGAPRPSAAADRTWESTKAHSPIQKPARQVLEGYVKGGVVHLLEGELPDGIFVKIIRE